MSAGAAMQQEDESKLKPQRFSPTMKWAAGVSIGLLGLGAWTLKSHGAALPSPAWAPAEVSNIHVLDSAPDAAELPVGPESLEAALSSLESGEDWASHGIHLPESTIEPPAAAAKARTTKGDKKAKGKSTAKESQPSAEAKAVEGDVLDRLSPPKEDKASPASNPEVAEALEKLEMPAAGQRGGKKSKKSKPNKADKEKAEAIIREFTEKLNSAPPAQGEEMDNDALKARLEALIAENPEADQTPDVKKAKSIIKDAMKKMGLDGKSTGQDKASKDKLDAEDDAADPLHVEFAKRLKEETEQKPLQDLASVRQEFKREYGENSRRLLCSGCKLVAARLSSELSNHDVHDADSPAVMLASKRRAIDDTCRSFRHIHVTAGSRGPRFEASEAPDEPEGDAAPRLGQRLCSALLEDAKFELLTKLIQRKVPAGSLFHHGEPASAGNNWERLLCAQRARVCKRNEVREDDDEEEL